MTRGQGEDGEERAWAEEDGIAFWYVAGFEK